jgi:hypothetical protein
MVPTPLAIAMLIVFAALMWGWHKIAILIVANYGIVGTAITFAALYGVACLMDRRARGPLR